MIQRQKKLIAAWLNGAKLQRGNYSWTMGIAMGGKSIEYTPSYNLGEDWCQIFYR